MDGSGYRSSPGNTPRGRSTRGGQFSPSPSPFGPGGWSTNRDARNSPASPNRSAGCRAASHNWSMSSSGSLPGFTPSPHGGRHRGGGRGGGGGRGRGGAGGLRFDDSFLHFATENPWAELERTHGLASPLGPFNTGSSRHAQPSSFSPISPSNRFSSPTQRTNSNDMFV